MRQAGGLAEIVGGGGGGDGIGGPGACGIAVEAGTPEAFAEAVRAITAADAATRRRGRLAARARAEAFGWDRVFGAMAARYDALTGRTGDRRADATP